MYSIYKPEGKCKLASTLVKQILFRKTNTSLFQYRKFMDKQLTVKKNDMLKIFPQNYNKLIER